MIAYCQKEAPPAKGGSGTPRPTTGNDCDRNVAHYRNWFQPLFRCL